MPDRRIKIVATYATPCEAHCRRIYLHQHGVEAEVWDTMAAAWGSGAAGSASGNGGIDLVVEEQDVERAVGLSRALPAW